MSAAVLDADLVPAPIRVVLFQRTDVSGPAAASDYEAMCRACVERGYEVVEELLGDQRRWAAPAEMLVSVCVRTYADGVVVPSADHLGAGLAAVSAVAYVLIVRPPGLWIRGKQVRWP